MAAELPFFDLQEFSRLVARTSPVTLEAGSVRTLFAHYEELRRWNRRMNLLGPGSVEQLFERHYGEALAALPLLERQDRVLVDIGSGAGFPGLVLAAAAPRLSVTLVESRERKWAFLMAAVRRAALPCRCLNARVNLPLPPGLPDTIDLVTLRAVKLGPDILASAAGRLRGRGRFLLWVGEEAPTLPAGLATARSVSLPGSEHRRILELRPTAQPAESPRTEHR